MRDRDSVGGLPELLRYMFPAAKAKEREEHLRTLCRAQKSTAPRQAPVAMGRKPAPRPRGR